jgi:hypothetical protein
MSQEREYALLSALYGSLYTYSAIELHRTLDRKFDGRKCDGLHGFVPATTKCGTRRLNVVHQRIDVVYPSDAQCPYLPTLQH